MKLQFNKKYFFGFLLFLSIEIGILFTNGFIRHTVGDYFVVFLVYCFLKSFLDMKVTTAVSIVLVFAFIVEFLQLTNLLDILHLENNNIAKTILGSSFSVGDLIAYSLGVGSIILIEKVIKISV